MERNEYVFITRTIGQAVGSLKNGNNLSKDDIDDIKNQTLLKLTPQLERILNFEKPHMKNFIRKTTRCAFWDYLKNMSPDLTPYRVKKRIRNILYNLEEAKSPFRMPDNNTPWYNDTKEINTEISDREKRIELENIFRQLKKDSQIRDKSFTSNQGLIDLIKTIFSRLDFGISVNDIFSLLVANADNDIEGIIRTSLEANGFNSLEETGNTVNTVDITPAYDLLPGDLRVDDRVYYENYAEEFLGNHATGDQIWVYYLKFLMNLGYKEIEEKYDINMKTAESRLSIKPDKKGFFCRLARFIKELDLNVEESQDFLNILNRKIGDLYNNDKLKKSIKSFFILFGIWKLGSTFLPGEIFSSSVHLETFVFNMHRYFVILSEKSLNALQLSKVFHI